MAKVSADDLRRGLAAICTIPRADRRDIRVRVHRLVALFCPYGSPAMIAAIDWRLQALSRVAECPEFKAWARNMDDSVHLDPNLLVAAAEEPLIVIDNEPCFDSDSFFMRLLALTEGHGNGGILC
jgi:hypothetical protein